MYTRIWNKLPNELRETQEKNTFKAKLKCFLLKRAKDCEL